MAYDRTANPTANTSTALAISNHATDHPESTHQRIHPTVRTTGILLL
ncbi:hypothetical protein [Mycolicibacterium llatzerense]|nr:hypothetical protein [Mycolicibacterium llatzerense]